MSKVEEVSETEIQAQALAILKRLEHLVYTAKDSLECDIVTLPTWQSLAERIKDHATVLNVLAKGSHK